MNANIHFNGMYVTPKWVFDSACAPREVQQKNPQTGAKDVAVYSQYEGKQVIPKDWNDPVYLKKLEAFLTALAKRYDGDHRLAWYEIRSYGNWGEGHLWPWGGTEPSPEQIFKYHVKLHKRIFKKTSLMAAETYFRSAEIRLQGVKLGVGIRDDGIISYRDGKITAVCDGLSPSCFEWGGTYEQFSSEGKIDKLEECVRNGHVYYCGFARYGSEDIKAFAENEKSLINRISNLMGYHLIIERVSLPKEITPGQEFEVSIKWLNNGVAKMWFPCSVALAMLDVKGMCVSRTWLDGSNPGTCPGKQTMTETLKGKFDMMPPNGSKIAIGLFRDRNSVNPDVKLGLKDITAKNWHPLATVTNNSK